jgi:hypothetical protein
VDLAVVSPEPTAAPSESDATKHKVGDDFETPVSRVPKQFEELGHGHLTSNPKRSPMNSGAPRPEIRE